MLQQLADGNVRIIKVERKLKQKIVHSKDVVLPP